MTPQALGRGDERLPAWRELWAATCGHVLGGHLITACVHRLALSYRPPYPQNDAQKARRRRLVCAIDAWAAKHLRVADRRVSIAAWAARLTAAAVAADKALRLTAPVA